MNPILRSELDSNTRKALELAETTLANSHCPHSGLCVSAGLLLEDGQVITGINYESDSYGLTLCAERTALSRAQAKGVIEKAMAIVISARWRANASASEPLTPCGACRQWLSELSHRLGRDLPVYSFWASEESGLSTTARELLPGSFSLDQHEPDNPTN
ncbi:cytidine deaminase [Puniceicoccales bacterium CK1056]|uniref:Cytidine deaminase n=1 Tax=Oceanipulchritudo coccoides TaxID=2706888 RepID=A0A6B2M2P4_9BACT|nr:cytidine deaminase [Oceanipulchritudo coccoides]NDV62347.1 cytidine deaminase [Oceanipulchritudo coccoides]